MPTRGGMGRPALIFLCVCALLALWAALPAFAAADGRLSERKARALAAKTAQDVRRDLAEDGATRASVPGCWRNNERRVSCYLKIRGYDAELDFPWTCMMRVAIELRPAATASRRFRYDYGTAICG